MDDDPVRWIETHFRIPETKDRRIILAPYQKKAIYEALSKNEEGKLVYSIVIWSDVKKSIKSTLAAAVALWHAWQVEWGQILLIANDLKQADSRVGYYLRRAIELNPDMRHVCKIRNYKVTLPNQTTIESIPIDPTGEAGSNADRLIYCLDEQTEIMTKDGWKGWSELSIDDNIATQNPANGYFEWQKPESIYCDDYSGEMYTLEKDRISIAVTPDHRLYGRFAKTTQQHVPERNALSNNFVLAKNITNSFWYFPSIAPSGWEGKIDNFFVSIPPTQNQKEILVNIRDWVEFMAWYLSEGCLIQKRGEKPYGICIAQSGKHNRDKRNQILDLLKRMNLPYREWAGEMTIAVWNLSLGEMLSVYGKSGDKFISENIKELPVEYLELFLKTYIDGDGYRTGKGWAITTNSIQMRDDLMEIAQKCGYPVADWQYIDKRWGGKTIQYTVRVFDKKHIVKTQRREWNVIDYSGKVFCPSTKNGIILARRRGRTFWTGNSELWGSHAKAQERMWCYDDQTEIYTQAGWIKGVDLTESDVIATYSREQNEIQWETPRAIYKERYTGDMHLYTTKTFNHCVTPNHRLLGKCRKGDDIVILSEDLRSLNCRTGFYFKKDLNNYEYVPKRDWKTIKYSGYVWCPSTRNGFIVTRRNGVQCISGNTEMTLSPTKFGKSQRWVETYAGFSGESQLLERLYEQGTKEGLQVGWSKEEVPPVEAYSNKGIGMFCLWNTTPRLPWQTQEYYSAEAAILTESEFNRVHRNKWSVSQETFVPYEWWSRCHVASMPPLDKNESVIVAMDAAVSSDCFGIVMVSGGDDGIVRVRYARKWTPEKGFKLSFEEPEKELRRLIDEYNVIEVAYDPYQLEDMAGRLNRELVAHMYAFNQGQERLISDKSLRDMIQNRKINHSGEPDLSEHIQNANAEITSGDKGLRLVKKSDSKKIDLAVSLSMAVSRASYWSL